MEKALKRSIDLLSLYWFIIVSAGAKINKEVSFRHDKLCRREKKHE